MAQKFIENGYDVVETEEMADVYIINTCTVTNMADRKSRQMLRRVKQINPNSIVVATGCYAQVAKDELQKIENIDLVLGINEKNDIVDYVNKFLSNKTKEMEISDVLHQVEFLDFGTVTHTEKTRMVIKIQDGCDRFCSYCLIPYARGHIRSRKIENVIEEIKKVVEEGINEVVITGIHIASYGRDFKGGNIGLIDLLEEINKIKGLHRIRLGSIEPTIITEEFVKRLSKLDKICDHFHLSLQSGCTETLKRMNRRYTTQQFRNIVECLRKYYEDVILTTDIIVGFPGETEEDFEDTLDVVSKVHFEQVYMFIYSRRVGTPADKMENQVPDEVKHERFDRLKKLAESQIAGNNQKYVNTIQKVLVEGKSKTNENMLTGRTETNKVVNFEGTDDMIGKIVNLKIVSEHMWYLKGEV